MPFQFLALRQVGKGLQAEELEKTVSRMVLWRLPLATTRFAGAVPFDPQQAAMHELRKQVTARPTPDAGDLLAGERLLVSDDGQYVDRRLGEFGLANATEKPLSQRIILLAESEAVAAGLLGDIVRALVFRVAPVDSWTSAAISSGWTPRINSAARAAVSEPLPRSPTKSIASRMPSGVTGPASSVGPSGAASGSSGGCDEWSSPPATDSAADSPDASSAAALGEVPITWAKAWAELVEGDRVLVYFHLFATSCFMNRSPSVANCRSLWYIRRQILVAATILSRANPKASITMRLS